MMLEDELDELNSVQKDLLALRNVAQMSASYPAWGGDSDTVRVIACALGSIIDKLRDLTDEIRSECAGSINVQP